DLLVTQEVDERGLQREGAHRPADVATDVVARDVVSHTGRHIDGTPRERVTGPYRHRRRRAVRVGVVSAVARSAEVGRTAVTAVVEGVGVRRLDRQALDDVSLEAGDQGDLVLLVQRDPAVQRLTNLDKRQGAADVRRPGRLERHAREVAAGEDTELVVVTAE